MHLAGFPLSAVLGVFGVAAACTVVLYILKLRRRPVAVVFSPIWQRVLGARLPIEQGRKFAGDLGRLIDQVHINRRL